MFESMASRGEFSHTFGSLDPVQVAQMAKYLTTIYGQYHHHLRHHHHNHCLLSSQ